MKKISCRSVNLFSPQFVSSPNLVWSPIGVAAPIGVVALIFLVAPIVLAVVLFAWPFSETYFEIIFPDYIFWNLF